MIKAKGLREILKELTKECIYPDDSHNERIEKALSDISKLLPSEGEILKTIKQAEFGCLTFKKRAEELFTDKQMGIKQLKVLARLIYVLIKEKIGI